MVVDDLGGGEQAEDPLPRLNAEAAAAPTLTTGGAASLALPAGGTIGGGSSRTSDGAAVSDESSERVPLWNRLPRSIWLM